jgi:hypothetical protein
MAQRLFRWAFRISVGIVAFFVVLWAILSILTLNPGGALLFEVMLVGLVGLVGQLMSTHHPPPVADGVIISGEREHIANELTDSLQKQFPVGTAGLH